MTEKAAAVQKYDGWSVYRKLARARVMLQMRNLKKSGNNKFAGFTYFELADFLPAVNEIFDELGLFAYFRIEDAYSEVVSEATGLMIENPSCAYLRICNIDKPGEEITFSSPIADAGTKGASPIQQLGSVHTYMRRYLYMEALEIVESDGLDALNGTDKIGAGQQAKPAARQQRKAAQPQQAQQAPAPITSEQIARIYELFAGNDQRLNDMMTVYKISAVEQLTGTQAAAIIKRMEGESR